MAKINTSTQKYLEIAEIKEDVVIRKDRTLVSVLLVSSINFALKSEDEQNAVISSYVSFLNNIDFPIQIVMQSRELNIDGYLESLKRKEKEQTNDLLKIQTNEYIQYIQELISLGKIMNKRFYVAVPYSPIADIKKGFLNSVSEAFKPAKYVKMKEKTFQKYKDELNRRVETVMNGLSSMGLTPALLDTQGLIELFYTSYNPGVSKNQDLVDVNEIRVTQ